MLEVLGLNAFLYGLYGELEKTLQCKPRISSVLEACLL